MGDLPKGVFVANEERYYPYFTCNQTLVSANTPGLNQPFSAAARTNVIVQPGNNYFAVDFAGYIGNNVTDSQSVATFYLNKQLLVRIPIWLSPLGQHNSEFIQAKNAGGYLVSPGVASANSGGGACPIAPSSSIPVPILFNYVFSNTNLAYFPLYNFRLPIPLPCQCDEINFQSSWTANDSNISQAYVFGVSVAALSL